MLCFKSKFKTDMARKSRILSSTGIYHAIIRSVNQQIIFEEDEDFRKFIYILEDCKDKYQACIYGYCLMSNHVHLLLKVPDDKISSFFKSLTIRFVLWYNQKYERYGCLLQGRFFSRPVENENYFLQVLKYIHANPVKAGMVPAPSEYRWSSSAAYYGAPDSLVDTELADAVAGNRRNLQNHFALADEMEDMDDVEAAVSHARDQLVEESAYQLFHQLTGCNSPSDIQKMPKEKRNRIIIRLYKNRISYAQIARFTGIPKTTVFHIVKRSGEA